MSIAIEIRSFGAKKLAVKLESDSQTIASLASQQTLATFGDHDVICSYKGIKVFKRSFIFKVNSINIQSIKSL